MNYGPSPYNTLQRYKTQQNVDHVITTLARGNNSRVKALKLTNTTCTPYPVRFMFLTDVCKRASQPLNGQHAQHKRFTSDTFTTIQNHVMLDDNFDTVQAPDPNIKQVDTMDRLFKTNRYTYDDPFGN
jgi:hypothetical protein